MRKKLTQYYFFSRGNLLRNLLMAAFLCVFSTAFLLSTPTVHAASAPVVSSSLIKITSANFSKYIHSTDTIAPKTLSSSVANSSVGAYQFTDNLQSGYNFLYVSTELNYNNYAMLRARAPSAGSWETYNWYYDSNAGTWQIQSAANSLYVAAELSYTGSNYAMLRARTAKSAVGPWEQFEWYYDSTYLFDVLYSVANGLYVSAEFGYSGANNGMLRARKGYPPQTWEQWII